MKLIFDIGANRGLFSDECLRLYNNCKIVMVEANPDLCEFLKKKYSEYNNIEVLNNLVSENDGEEIDFYLSDEYDVISTASLEWINNSRFSKNYNWNRKLKIKSIKIDTLVTKFGIPDLIKIDVEGYEFEVLKGMTNKYKDVCFEWAEEKYEDTNKCCLYLENLGYENFGYIFTDNYMVKPNEFNKWSESSFHEKINIDRKLKWGMIWVK
jgi:FkbM family methyltransferase